MIFSDSKRAFKVYDGKKEAKPGTAGNPLQLRVKTEQKKKEIAATLEKKGWVGTIEVDPEKPEELTALHLLEKPVTPVRADDTPGRNDPCPCGSGKKYKKCHGA